MSYAKIKGRAETDEAKRQVCEAIYKVWTNNPQLRLGQLLFNALASNSYPACNTEFHHVIFGIEDDELANKLASYTKKENDHDRDSD